MNIRSGQTVVLDFGSQKRAFVPGSAPAIPSDEHEAGTAFKHSHRSIEEVETLLVVTADLVPEKQAKSVPAR